MKKTLTLLLLLAGTAALVNAQADSTTTKPTNFFPAQLSLIYPVGTSGINSENYTYGLSLNATLGYVDGIRGVEFGGVGNIHISDVKGATFAGVFNHTEGTLKGMQASGVYSYTGKADKGIQLSGVASIACKGSAVQLSGVTNIAATSNAQISGVINIADTASFQLGLTNVIGKGRKGTQIGLVNVRDSAGGTMIGLVNIIRKKEGRLFEVEAAGSEFVFMAASLRTGTQKVYSIVSFGWNSSDKFFATGVGIGRKVQLNPKWAVSGEAMVSQLFDKNFRQDRLNLLTQVRLPWEMKLGGYSKLFVGPSFNLYISDNRSNTRIQASAPYTILSRYGRLYAYEFWVGFTAGIRFS